jgi:hypothetical protein
MKKVALVLGVGVALVGLGFVFREAISFSGWLAGRRMAFGGVLIMVGMAVLVLENIRGLRDPADPSKAWVSPIVPMPPEPEPEPPKEPEPESPPDTRTDLFPVGGVDPPRGTPLAEPKGRPSWMYGPLQERSAS